MPEQSFHPGDQLGHYRLSKKIGSGGQGEVWLARDERFDRNVALKILPTHALADSRARERFRREAQAVGKLNHPNIATAHDFDTKPVDYLVTEYVPGSGLDQRLAAGALPEETVIALGVQLAAGLEAAHREGIIHRDLKPGNLRITDNGTLKILDFGLAEMFDPSKDAASMETVTINMTLTGTLPYMAPEQFAGISDQRSDVWSAGAVIYEMATGHLLFPGAKIHEVRDAILNSRPKPPREVNPAVSPGLERVILRCLQKKPADRYQSAGELREDLERLAEGRKTKDAEKQRGREFALAALAVVLVVSALAGIYYWPQIRNKFWPAPEQAASQFRLLAILPVDTTGQGPSDNALVRGMAETVSARIAQATNGQRLQLIPPSELIARDAHTTDAVRREFGVDRVLEVAVQRSGDKVRVTCSLIDSKTHQVLNACTVTGNDADLFALQDTLAGEVIAMLPQPARNEQEAPEVVHAAPPAGYEFYLKGRGYLLEYQKPENIDAAIKEFEQALKVSSNYAPAYAGLGEAYWHAFNDHRGDEWLGRAKASCEKAGSIDAKLAEGHTCLSDVYRSQGKYAEALEQILTANKIDPRDDFTLIALGDTYDKLGKTSDAEATFRQATMVSPNYWAAFNWLGVFYSRHGRYSDAAAQFQKVTEIEPDNYRGYDNLSAMRILQGNYDRAIQSLNRSIELKPSMTAYSNLGSAYFWMHRYPDAITAYEKARSLDDMDYQNLGNLGDALYWSPNRRAESAAAYKQAIALAQGRLKINPKDATARAFAAQYYAMLGDQRTATTEVLQAVDQAPHDPDVLFRAALVYNQFGDQRHTLEWLQKAVAANFSRTTVRDTPDFDHLKSDPAFKAIIAGA
jgi:eukaryotic-like serine/threonine-protein kinase